MDYTNIKQNMMEFAKKIVKEELCGIDNDFISYRCEDGMLITKEGAMFSKLKDSDILLIQNKENVGREHAIHLTIYNKMKNVNAIYHAHPKYATVASEVNVTLPAVLDDVAQIVGESIKVSTRVPQRIIDTLKNRNSCLILNDGALTTGRTMDEAYTCLMVLEKGAKCYITASVLGKAKPISKIEAKIMRFVYKKKYSKADQADKLADERK